MAITIDSDGKKVYVLSTENVSVIDTSTNTVTATVSVGHDPLDFAIIQDGTKVYTANHDDNSVSVIDTATNTVTEIPVREWPDTVVVSPDGKKVYVTCNPDVYVISTKIITVIATLPFTDVKVYSAGKKVYVVNSYGNKFSVWLINTKTNTVTAKAKVTGLSSPDKNKIVFNPTGTKMYVADFWNNNVSVINTKTNTVIARVPLGAQSEEIAVNPAGTMAYVVNGNNVSVINTKTNTVTDTVPVGSNPGRIAVTPDGTKVYVVNRGTFDIPSNTVSVIDTSTNTTEVSNSNYHKLGNSKMKVSLSKHKQKNHSRHHKAG
jgi:YVTN family beta-propeller protein